jgi:hypothetical protein
MLPLIKQQIDRTETAEMRFFRVLMDTAWLIKNEIKTQRKNYT